MIALLVIAAIAISMTLFNHAKWWYNFSVFELGEISAQKSDQATKINFVALGHNTDCKGKDSRNYSLIATQESDAQCSQNSIVTKYFALIASKANGEKAVINFATLATLRYPDGGKFGTSPMYKYFNLAH